MKEQLSISNFTLVVIAVLAMLIPTSVYANTHLFIPVSLGIHYPQGPFPNLTGAQRGFGFSLGFEFTADRHLFYGAHGTWTRLGLGRADTADYSSFGLTNVGLIASVKLKLFKHGWSPYTRLDAGMGFLTAENAGTSISQRISGLGTVKTSLGASAGVQIPLSDAFDLDVSARYSTTFTSPILGLLSANVGMVYTIPR